MPPECTGPALTAEREDRPGGPAGGTGRGGESGTPQGGVIPPAGNSYLHPLDAELRAARFGRYADDFVVLADRRWKVQAADRLVRAILADIGLEVAEAKSGIRKVSDGFEFLAFQCQGRFLRPRP